MTAKEYLGQAYRLDQRIDAKQKSFRELQPHGSSSFIYIYLILLYVFFQSPASVNFGRKRA